MGKYESFKWEIKRIRRIKSIVTKDKSNYNINWNIESNLSEQTIYNN